MRPLIISKHDGTVFVISMVPTPPSMAARQAWKPASAFSVRSTPHRRLGKTSAMDRTPSALSRSRSRGSGLTILVHTYDRGHRDREHPRPDHPRGGRLPPRKRLLRHEREG